MLGVGDGHDHRLHGSEPDGERAGDMLYEAADEALHRPKHDAVDHDDPVLGAVRTDVVDIEAVGEIEIDLDRRPPATACPSTSLSLMSILGP